MFSADDDLKRRQHALLTAPTSLSRRSSSNMNASTPVTPVVPVKSIAVDPRVERKRMEERVSA